MNGTLLVVDDSSVMRKVVVRTLKMAGIEFESNLEAGDAVDAIARLEAHKVDLIVCDINMPGMNGLELLEKIQAENLAPDVPIVVVSTEGSELHVRRAIKSGARGYIRKPFSVQQILNSIRPLLVSRNS